MPNILLSNYYSDNVLQVVNSLLPEGFRLLSLEEPGKAGVIKKAAEADYFLVGGRTKIDVDVLNAAPKLKMIQRSGVGLDSIDLIALQERGIPLYVNAGINARSVAEHTIMLTLGILRQVHVADNNVRRGKWVKHDLGIHCHDLYRKTVGLIGMGNIGQYVAKMLRGFDVDVVYTKRSQLSIEVERELGVTFCSLDKLLACSDIVSLHCPLTSDTKEIINKQSIGLMKKGAYLINTARGGLVNEDDLASALEKRLISGAALDVFSKEPLAPGHHLVGAENTLLTPHMGGITIETFSTMISSAFKNIMDFESGNFEKINQHLFKF